MMYDMINHMRVKALADLLRGDVGQQHANELITDAEFLQEIREVIGELYQAPDGSVDMNTGLRIVTSFVDVE